MKRILFISVFFVFIYIGVKAQKVGSFDTSLPFAGGSRAVSLFVPSTYNPAVKYHLMICLHDRGDSCSSYRDTLINGRGWAANLPNTIFVFPEAPFRDSDYYVNGGEGIIAQSIAFAKANYNIDTSNMVLQGFSLGGRAALRYGLYYYRSFKGLLINSPAIQGIKESLNQSSLAYSFSYGGSAYLPIYLTCGALDTEYTNVLDTAFFRFTFNNGIVRYLKFAGVGHNLPLIQQLLGFTTFFDTPAHKGLNIELVPAFQSKFVCKTGQETVNVFFRNTGADTIKSARFACSLYGKTFWAKYIGRLYPYALGSLAISLSNLVVGNNTIIVDADTLIGTHLDTATTNSQLTTDVLRIDSGYSILNEGFEGPFFPPIGWTLQIAGDYYSPWTVDHTVASSGNQSANAFNTMWIFDNAGRAERLITPPISLPATNPMLLFDVAYNYHRFTPPYFSTSVDFADTLQVLVSTDCGVHYTQLYKKGGIDLSTFASPIINPLSLSECLAKPGSSNWRTESIDLNGYQGSGNQVFIQFSYKSALGGSVNINNIRIEGPSEVQHVVNNNLKVFPNPAMDEIHVTANVGIEKIDVMNIFGQSLLSYSSIDHRNDVILDTHILPTGTYLIRTLLPGKTDSRLLTIR